mgnify:CR=1 FL=1
MVVNTLYGTVMLSWMVDAFDFLQYNMVISDPLLSSMMAGVTTGVGLGMVYRVGGNTGGLDPIALIVRKYYGLQMGSINSVINAVILAASSITSFNLLTCSKLTATITICFGVLV